MTKSIFSRMGAFMAVTFLTLTILTACSPAGNDQAADQAAADAYIRMNVSQLSPTPAVLGGTFMVTDIEWEDADTAIVSYEDGHIALQGRADIVKNGDEVTVSEFVIVEDNGFDPSASSSVATGTGASSSAEALPSAKEGEACGGIAGIQCEPSLLCKYDGAYPDAAGVCVK